MVSTISKYFTVSTMLFHKYGGSNIGVTNCMPQFYMFVPINANAKMSNGNTGNAVVIGIILCYFPN